MLARSCRTRTTYHPGMCYARSGTHVFALVLLGCGGFLLFLEMEGIQFLGRSSDAAARIGYLHAQLDELNRTLSRRIAELAPIAPPTPPMGAPAIIKPPIEEEEQEEQPPVNGEDQYRSQAGQDKLVLGKVFNRNAHINRGFFIEFGARNGVDDSNTHYFEKALNWRGVLLEAIPSEQRDIAQSRPRSAVINGAVCEGDSATFLVAKISGLNGMASDYDPVRIHSSDLFGDQQKLTVKCRTLRQVVKEFGIKRVNYMSVDTEGSELQALMTFPFGEIVVDVVGVEVLLGTPERQIKEKAVIDFMASQDYEVLEVHKFAPDTADIFFVPGKRTLAKAADVMYNKTAFLTAKWHCSHVSRECL